MKDDLQRQTMTKY